MKKKLIGGAVVIVVLGALGVGYVALTGPTTLPNPTPGTFPASDAVNPSGSTSFTTVQTSEGQALQTIDFIRDPATVQDPVNPGYYYLGYHSFGDQEAISVPYMIEYIKETQYFNIEILEEPLGQTRKVAEQYLLAHLGISQEEMCMLDYTVSVPSSVNNYYASSNLGFSFCPGAVTLP